MKRIIICEGKNDGIFILKILEQLGIGQVKPFSLERLSQHERKSAEAKVLYSFLQCSSPYQCLVKLEGGKKVATKIFCREISRFFSYSDDSILLLDSDTGSPTTKINEVIKNIKAKYANTTSFSFIPTVEKETKHFHHSSVKVNLQSSGKEKGNFRIMFLKNRLEDLCHINKEDSEEEKESKIGEFIKTNEMVPLFSFLK